MLIDADHSVYKQEMADDVPLLDRYLLWSKRIVYQKEWGKEVGHHDGAHFFTIGQRKGLAVGGTKEPLFVIGVDVDTNTIYVGEGRDHPGLFSKGVVCE